jgi:calcium-translocating P-type ATPase
MPAAQPAGSADLANSSFDPEEGVEPLLRHLATGPGGLSSREAARRQLVYGRNELVRRHPRRWPRQLAAQFTHPLALLLVAAAALAFVGDLTPLAAAILAVVALNAVLAFAQERHAERAVEELAGFLPPRARVLRDGREIEVDATELVPGDLVLLAEGERVSADIRLLAGTVEVDMSALTGESVAVSRSSELADTGVPLLEARDLVFSGTSITAGEGHGVVFATGMATQLGRIAALAEQPPQTPSPLQVEVRRVAWLIGAIALGAAAAFIPIGTFAAGLPLGDAVVFAIGLLVANVPEGLLPTITLALAVGVRELAGRGALVKRLNAVETLGATTVICTDKTGTLTENRMRAIRVWSPEPGPDADRAIFEVAAAANNAALSDDGPRGDPTEIALLELAAAHGIDVDENRRRRRRIRHFHFDPRLRTMTVVERVPAGAVVRCKGAPDAVVDRCTLDRAERERILREADALAAEGLRVLGFAQRRLTTDAPEERADAERDLEFAGLVGLLDPPRPAVPGAVARCRAAGVRILVVSGDHGLTAAAIARRVGIADEHTPVVSGRELDALTEAQLDELLRRHRAIVFARTSPEGKLRIADALQAQGETVAMTGDGVNDAPALRSADIGVAMGRSGTDVARESATIVLTDDDFASIVAAIEEGRRVYSNIRKFITYIFAHAPAEIVPFLAFALSGGAIPLPLTVMQILAIDLGTETLPALALGRERGESDLMSRPPRSRTDRIIDRRLLVRAWLILGGISAVLVLGGFAWVLLRAGWAPGDSVSSTTHDRATSMTFLGIVACQVGAGIACRTERACVRALGLTSNPLLLWGIAFELAFAAAVVWLPPLQPIFGTHALGPADVAILLPFPACVLAADALARRRHRRGGRAVGHAPVAG